MPISTQNLVDQNQIDRYIRNELSDAELTEFEISLLEDEGLYQMVCEAEAMAGAFKAEPVIKPRTTRAMEYLSLGFWIQQPASIAACLLLVTSLSFQFNPYFTANNAESLSGLGISSELLLESQRSQRNTCDCITPTPEQGARFGAEKIRHGSPAGPYKSPLQRHRFS